MPLEFFLMDNPLQCENKNKEQYEFPLLFPDFNYLAMVLAYSANSYFQKEHAFNGNF